MGWVGLIVLGLFVGFINNMYVFQPKITSIANTLLYDWKLQGGREAVGCYTNVRYKASGRTGWTTHGSVAMRVAEVISIKSRGRCREQGCFEEGILRGPGEGWVGGGFDAIGTPCSKSLNLYFARMDRYGSFSDIT